MVTCALVGLVAGIALPSQRAQILKSRRADGALALTRLQDAAERYRAHHGHYAADLQALGVRPLSAGGHYTLALDVAAAERYQARAVAQGDQRDDAECPALVLDVNAGFARNGPSPRCWGR